ncbi:hypothetical protein [Bradyrhizobium algeriense]|uniref:hypothetical protein n=1 Tax=Bradyrhizobium algeriense TaxID=634784 RepID=UPI0011AE84F1|nr:hypothetical protein [Bradyrhizobium algeriense]
MSIAQRSNFLLQTLFVGTALNLLMLNLVATRANAQQDSCAMASIKSGGTTTDQAEANFKKLNECLSALTLRLVKAETELAKLRNGLLSAASERKPVGGLKLDCPEGYYLTSVQFQDQSGLAHGALWGPSATCAKLNVGQARP